MHEISSLGASIWKLWQTLSCIGESTHTQQLYAEAHGRTGPSHSYTAPHLMGEDAETEATEDQKEGSRTWLQACRYHPFRFRLFALVTIATILPLMWMSTLSASTELGIPDAMQCQETLWENCGLQGVGCQPYNTSAWSAVRCGPYCAKRSVLWECSKSSKATATKKQKEIEIDMDRDWENMIVHACLSIIIVRVRRMWENVFHSGSMQAMAMDSRSVLGLTKQHLQSVSQLYNRWDQPRI